MASMMEIVDQFQKDLDEIALTLIRAFRLEYKREIGNLSDPLCRWMDFRLRYIDPFPRKIFLSHKFPKPLPDAVANGLDEIRRKILEGKDINCYQSKGLIQFNDFSGKRAEKRTDLLWADWGITHLHVTDNPIPRDQFFSNRSCSNGESWLLFCLFAGNTVGFIDLRPHDDTGIFTDRDLIQTVRRIWPEHMERFKLKGVLGAAETWTNEQIAMLRRKGVNAPIVIDGEVFMGPGMGIATSNTPVLVTERADRVRDWVDSLAKFVSIPDEPLWRELRTRNVEEPELSLCLTPQGLAVHERNSDVAFVFNHLARGDTYSSEMESLICPVWAHDTLMSFSTDLQ